MEPVPADGETLGEVMFRGNVVMRGYLKNPSATEAAFKGGWFHSGDLGVKHPDGYIQLKDRSKDIIISGGENISSIEVEEALFKHPAVAAAAVVAKPDEKWGETPCAFVELKGSETVSAEELIGWCRRSLAGFKVPGTSSSRNCRRPRPERCRSSCCGRWRRPCDGTPAIRAGRRASRLRAIQARSARIGDDLTDLDLILRCQFIADELTSKEGSEVSRSRSLQPFSRSADHGSTNASG